MPRLEDADARIERVKRMMVLDLAGDEAVRAQRLRRGKLARARARAAAKARYRRIRRAVYAHRAVQLLFRALRELPCLSALAQPLELLLTTGNGESLSAQKAAIIEDIAFRMISALQEQSLTEAVCGDLEKHAYSVNDQIENSAVRNAHILSAVQ